MPDNIRMPRIGEIWEMKNGKSRVLVVNCGKSNVYIMYDSLSMNVSSIDTFLATYKPTNIEYNLDTLVLILKERG